MTALFTQPLFYIYFVYGISFLVMSCVLLHGIKKATAISLISTFHALAAFGITHGITELVDWARFILKFSGHGEVMVLKYLSQSLLILSFVILLQFAVNLFTYKHEKNGLIRAIPAALLAVYLFVLFITKTDDISKAGLLARHGFGFLGALLSGIALFSLAQLMESAGDSTASKGLFVGAVGFGLYSVFGGLIIQPIAGVPIQLFRAACAVTIAVSSFYFLGVFEACEAA